MSKKVSTHQNYRTISYFVGAILTAILAVIAFFVPENKIAIAIGILSVNIILLSTTILLSFEQSFREQKDELRHTFDEQEDKISAIKTQIQSTLQNFSSIVQLEKVNEMILEVNDDVIRSQYQTMLAKSLTYILNCIKEKRSGELEDSIYYDLLHKAGNKILEEKNSVIGQYSGEIRAMTFWLAEELDMRSEKNGDYERNWLEKMKNLDRNGIRTRRLCVFDKEKLKLLKQKDTDTEKFLEKLKNYCTNDSVFQNTESKAISYETLTSDDADEFRKGFFSIKLANNITMLIYGVAKEKVRTAKALCGEIDYDEHRKNEILEKWEKLWNNTAIPLNIYLVENSGDEVKNYMKTLHFIVDE